MERLLPKNDYFKHTTRRLLSEEEKRETIAAVERSCQYLGRICANIRSETSTEGSFRKVFRQRFDSLKYLGRWTSLIKGSTQPRHLYRRRRRFALEMEARKIAGETGANYQEVRHLFMRFMNKYISEHP
jgi:hypothetical protein